MRFLLVFLFGSCLMYTFLSLVEDAKSSPSVGRAESRTSARPVVSGLASSYGPGLYGNPTGCRRPNGSRRYLSRSMVGVAHKSLPCNTKLTVCQGRRCAHVVVIDRGPYSGSRVLDLTEATTRRAWGVDAKWWGVRTVTYTRGWQ